MEDLLRPKEDLITELQDLRQEVARLKATQPATKKVETLPADWSMTQVIFEDAEGEIFSGWPHSEITEPTLISAWQSWFAPSDQDMAEDKLRQSQSYYQKLAQQNQQLLQQARYEIETKTTLLHEINHRVKNQLTAVIGLLYAEQQFAGDKCQKFYQTRLNKLIACIQGLAKVHHLLTANGWAPLQISDLIQQISEATLQLSPQNKYLSVHITSSPLRVTPEQANHLGIIVHELITNSIKYASSHASLTQPVQLHIETRLDAPHNLIELEFRDNGQGYSDEILTDTTKKGGLGLHLIRTLVRRGLQGQLNLRNEQGAVALISFKRQSSKRQSSQTGL